MTRLAHIRVQSVKDIAGGTVEVLLHGRHSDAAYVRGALDNVKGVRTTEPKQVPGARADLLSFQAKGPHADPLTKAKAIRVLKNDPYIEILAKA